ncbi:MAG: DUF3298 and DUF4163 domain-containing protein [Flavobacteriaceae bacterium]
MVFLFFMVFSCKKEVNKIVFATTNITTPDNTIVEINIPKALGDSKISETINIEILKTVKLALTENMLEARQPETVAESIIAFNREYTDFMTDFPDSAQIWEAQIDGEIMLQTPEVISLSVTSYINTGGAHGSLYITLLNFDALTGKSIPNTTLFNNVEAFKTVARTHFNEAVKDDTMLFEPLNFELPQNIGYNEDGLVLLYNTYEIAPYASGIIEFKIPYDEISGLLTFKHP